MKSHNRSAFTLVELLVVIGIIALLISVLLPAVNRARQSAQTVKCLSNLRQFGITSANYTSENRGVLFPVAYDQNSTAGGTYSDLPMVLARYMPAARKDVNNSNSDALKKGAALWNCPSSVQTVGANSNVLLAYGANKGVHVHWKYSSNLPKYTLARITRLNRQHELVAMVDLRQPNNGGTNWNVPGWIDYSESDTNEFKNFSDADKTPDTIGGTAEGWGVNRDGATGYYPRYRHAGNKLGNFLFVDGHCESKRQADIKRRNFSVNY